MTYLRRETKEAYTHPNTRDHDPWSRQQTAPVCLPRSKSIRLVVFTDRITQEAYHVEAPELLQADLRNHTQGDSICIKKYGRSEYFSQKQ